MPGIILSTHFPPSLFTLRTNADSVLTEEGGGNARLTGGVEVVLLGANLNIKLDTKHKWRVGRAVNGARPLLEATAVVAKTDLIRAGDGPGFQIRRWRFEKKSGHESVLQFPKLSVWSCGTGAASMVPGAHDFELLLPGLDVTGAPSTNTAPDISDTWVQNGNCDAALRASNGEYFIECLTRLYMWGSTSATEAGITFKPAEGLYFPPVRLYANYRKQRPTLLRLPLNALGAPMALELTDPGGTLNTAPLRFALPQKFPVSLEVTPGTHAQLPLERIRIEAGRLLADVHPQVRLTLGFGACAHWSLPGRRMQLAINLPRAQHDTIACTEIEFRDRPAPSQVPLADQRFDGLRISGISSIGRKTEVLDARDVSATVLLFAGMATPANPLARLRCGWLGPREGQVAQDGSTGVLDMPVRNALLRIQRAGATPLAYSLACQRSPQRWQGELKILAANLLVPPFGGAASMAGAFGEPTRNVHMKLRNGAAIVATQTSASAALTLMTDWREKWTLDGAQRLALHELANLDTTFSELALREASLALQAEENEPLAYAGLVLALAYLAGAYEGQGWAKFFATELVLKLDNKALQAWAEHNRLKDLIVCLGALSSNTRQQAWFRNFVSDNLKPPAKPVSGALWPLASSLGIPLYEIGADQSVRWVWDVVRDGGPTRCWFGFDYSAANTINFSGAPFPADFIATQSRNLPALWPRSRPAVEGMMPGALEDPGSKAWSGIFMFDVPLVVAFDVPPDMHFLRNVRDGINGGLRLDYGWLDAAGHTWNASWRGRPKRLFPFDATPNPPVELLLHACATAGSRSQAVSSTLHLQMILHAIQTDQGKPVTLDLKGDFGMAVGQQSSLEMSVNKKVATSSFPGFDSVEFKRFRTDFSSGTLEVALVPGQELREAIPFFDQEQLLGSMTLPLAASASQAPTLALRMPAEAPTRLLGKWEIGVRAIEFDLGTLKATTVHFALNLGLPGLSRIGGRVKFTVADRQLQCFAYLDQLAFDLSAFGVRIDGQVQWREPGHVPGSPAPDTPVAIAAGARNDFYGAVRLSGLAETGAASLYLRIGAGTRPYWVAALMKGQSLDLAGKGLANTRYLLAQGAQPENPDALRAALTAPEQPLPIALFPEPGEHPIEWLNKWTPTADGTGLVVGMTGRFGIHPLLAGAPDSKDNLSVLWSDTGLFYAGAKLQLFHATQAELRLLVNFRDKLMTAGLQLQKLSLGEGTELSAGLFTVTVSWGERKGFGFSLGYPPVMQHQDLDIAVPDWSKAVTVRIREAWPVNTYQGGMKAWSYTNPRSYGFGVAIRVGYSNSFSVTGNNIADARADIGVMVGGTFEFCGAEASPTPPSVVMSITGVDADAAWLADAVLEVLASGRRDEILISATIFGDIWGHASVVFMGVTLAGVRLDARAAFNVTGTFKDGIQYMGADYSFNVRVKIGCSSFGTSCRFRVLMVNRGGSGQPGQCNQFMRELRTNLLEAK